MITITKQEALRKQAEQVARYACIYGIEVAVAVAAGTSAAALQDDVEYPVHVINRHIPRGAAIEALIPAKRAQEGFP